MALETINFLECLQNSGILCILLLILCSLSYKSFSRKSQIFDHKMNRSAHHAHLKKKQ